MTTKAQTTEQRIAAIEEQVKTLSKWHHEHECNRQLAAMAQRIANRLFELDSDKVDMRMIAELNAALGCDIMPLSNKAPKKVRKYATKGIKPKKP